MVKKTIITTKKMEKKIDKALRGTHVVTRNSQNCFQSFKLFVSHQSKWKNYRSFFIYL